MNEIINEFKFLEDVVKKSYPVKQVVLHTFSSDSCVLDVVIENVLTVFQYSKRLNSFGLYSGTSDEIELAETKVFKATDFTEAKKAFLLKLDSLVLS